MNDLNEAFRAHWVICIYGWIVFFAGLGVLYWNEGYAVHIQLSLDETYDGVYSMIFNAEEMEQNFDGRIVHLAGPLHIWEPLTEPDYNIQLLAVHLKRRVQMYQWVEETVEHNYGESVGTVESDTKTYYYTREWRDKVVDSRNFYNRFGHTNPSRFPIESGIQEASVVCIGKYELGRDVKAKFMEFKEVTSDIRPEDSSIKLHLGLYYHTNDVFNPEVGDVRIHFTYDGMEGETYTIVGKLQGNRVVPYITSRGVPVLLVYLGGHTVPDVFAMEHRAQKLRTWCGRFVGWLLVFIGVSCNTKLLRVLLMRVPLLMVLAPDPLFPVSGNFFIAISLALIIAAVAWIVHRPVVGACLLLAGASPFFWFTRNFVEYQLMEVEWQ